MGRMRGSLVTVSMSLAVLLLTAQAVAQPRDGRLSITVVDQTGGVLPSAVVTIAGQDEAIPVSSVVVGFQQPVGHGPLDAEHPALSAGLCEVRRRA